MIGSTLFRSSSWLPSALRGVNYVNKPLRALGVNLVHVHKMMLPPEVVSGKRVLGIMPAILGGSVVFVGAFTQQPPNPQSFCMDEAPQSKVAKKGSQYLNDHRLHKEPKWLNIDLICQDPSNRDEEGTKVDEVLAKAELIENQGFDMGKVRCVIIQMPLGEEARGKILSKQKDWKAEDERYPVSDDKLIEYTCVGGNHLLTFLKMVKAEIHCSSFVSLQGGGSEVMSLSLLGQMDPEFAKAVSTNIPCVVLSRDVRSIEGALADIQASENQGHSLNTLESDKQCILRCASRIAQSRSDVETVESHIQAQFPHLREHVPGYIKFTQEMGGLDSIHFRYWKVCDARFGSNTAGLRGKFLEEICSMSPNNPYTKRAVVLAARFVPRSKIPPRLTIVDWFSVTDIKKLVSKSEEELEAIESLLTTFEQTVKEISTDREQLLFQARSDCRLMRHVLDKKDKGFPTFDDQESILKELKIEVAEFLKSKRSTPRTDKEREDAPKAVLLNYVCMYTSIKTGAGVILLCLYISNRFDHLLE